MGVLAQGFIIMCSFIESCILRCLYRGNSLGVGDKADEFVRALRRSGTFVTFCASMV